jgi:hypothetical protein
MHVYRGTNYKLVHIFQLQKSITIYLVYICCNFFIYMSSSSSWKSKSNHKFEKLLFHVVLITYKCMPLCKKLDYDAKSEPSYLATTLQ